MDIKKEIETWTPEFNTIFEKEIRETLKRQVDLYKIENTIDTELEEIVLAYSHGGKRIRPFIALLVSQKDFNDKDVLNTCLALELFHLSALIHDDIIDNADLRRGKKTIHYFANNFIKNKKTLGTDIALLVGDVFLTRAFYYAAKLPEFVQELFFTMSERTIRGQYIDVLGANEDYGNVTKDAVYTRHMLKTAWYTFGSPAYMGLILSEKKYTQNEIDIIIEVALEIGLLYQIRDDIHDCTNEKSGKKLFGDIFEGQTTWVTLFLKEHYPDIFEESKAFAKLPQTDENIDKLKALYQNIDFQEPYANEMQKVIQKIDKMPSELDTVKQKFHAILTLFGL